MRKGHIAEVTLEFKRRFIKIKNALEDIVLKGPTTWPIAIATNSVP